MTSLAKNSEAFTYDSFISYSHEADVHIAGAMVHALNRIAKPWYRRPPFRIFLDKASLGLTDKLWSEIKSNLKSSRYLIYLACPLSASRPWVIKELKYWLEHRDTSSLLLVLTDGEIMWDPSRSDFDWEATTALPEAIRDMHTYKEEPRYLDLRSVPKRHHITLDDGGFFDAIATISAMLRGVEKDTLVGDHITQRKRTRLTVSATLVILVALSVGLAITAHLAETRRQAADTARRVALARQLAAQADQIRTQLPRAQDVGALLALESLSWALGSGQEVREHTTPAPGNSHRLSPGGQYLAVIRKQSRSLTVHDVEDGRKLLQINYDGSWPVHRFSPNGTLLSTIKQDGTAEVWSLEKGRKLASYNQYGAVCRFRFSDDNASSLRIRTRRHCQHPAPCGPERISSPALA